MKNQKNSGLFWFFAWMVFTCLLKICPKTKKDLSFFGFCLTSSKSSFKKPKKTLSCFSFFNVMTKKTKKTRGKPKKNKHEPQTKHSLKSFGFLVFWFFRGTSQLFDDSLGEKPWGKPKNIEKTKKPKLFRECLV